MAYTFTKDDKKRIIYADITKLTERDKKKIRTYLDLGYTIEEVKAPKQEAKPEWTEKAIRDYLKKNATKEQQEKYNSLYNAPQIDKDTNQPKTYKNNSKDGKHKKGDIKPKGHIATLSWFKKEFPDYGK